MSARFRAALLASTMLAAPAFAQQATAPKCPDYSLQLAQAVQAFSDRDAFAGRAQLLDAQVSAIRAELKDANDKLTADDAIIQTYRAKETKPAEPAKPEAKP